MDLILSSLPSFMLYVAAFLALWHLMTILFATEFLF